MAVHKIEYDYRGVELQLSEPGEPPWYTMNVKLSGFMAGHGWHLEVHNQGHLITRMLIPYDVVERIHRSHELYRAARPQERSSP